MTRLKDIAAAAGVSTMTVSKVLRDAPDISAATKVRVRKLAQEMGYLPNATARGLRNRTTQLIGLVLSAPTNPMFARLLLGIEEQAFEHGYEIILAHSLNLTDREEDVIRRLLARRVDGFILAPVPRLEPTAPIYAELRERRVPTVLLGHPAPFCAGFIHASTDDLAGSAALTRHLLDLGHRRIAFLAGPSASPSAIDCLEGYRRALRDAGMEPSDDLIFKAGTTIEEGAQAALQVLQEQPHITALQAANDLVAVGAANVFLQQGRRIPQDLSIVGFGNFLISEHFHVPLTTIRQPKLRLGIAAMDLLFRQLRGEHPSNKQLPTEIVIRESTAPPQSQALP